MSSESEVTLMSPKERTRQLVFVMWGGAPSDADRELVEVGIDNAIYCALEEVKLILSLELREIPYNLYSGPTTSCRDYWEEVKLELEKL